MEKNQRVVEDARRYADTAPGTPPVAQAHIVGLLQIVEEMERERAWIKSLPEKNPYTNNGDIREDAKWRVGYNACLRHIRNQLHGGD